MTIDEISDALPETSNGLFDHVDLPLPSDLDDISAVPAFEDVVPKGRTDEARDDDFSDDSDMSLVAKRFPRKSGVLMPMVIDIDKAQDASPENPVIVDDIDKSLQEGITYEAVIHNFAEEEEYENFSTIAVAKYVSKRPFNPKVELLRSSELSQNNDQRVDNDGQTTPLFKGCVLMIRYKGQARMPWLEYSLPNLEEDDVYNRRNPRRTYRSVQRIKTPAMIYNSDKIPDLPSKHDIAYWSSNSLIIKSPYLMLVLFDIIPHWPQAYEHYPTLDPKWEVDLPYPYPMLLHHYDLIGKYLDGSLKLPENSENKTEEEPADAKDEIDHAAELDIGDQKAETVEQQPELAREHLALLYRYLTPIYEAKIPAYKLVEAESVPMVSFESLWYYFKPGTVVYAIDKWTPWFAAVVHTAEFGTSGKTYRTRTFSLDTWFLSSDGATISRCSTPLSIYRYTGVRALTELDVCPAEIWDRVKGNDRRNEAIKRGGVLEKAFRNSILLANYSATDGTQDLGASGKVVVDHRRGQEMTGLRTKCSLLRSDPEKDRYFDWDRIFVNEPWTWGPQQATIREGFAKRNETPRRAKPPPRYNNYLDDDVDYDDRRYPEYASPSLSRKILPRCAREHTSADDSLMGIDFPRQARGEVLSKPLTDEQKLLLYPLTFGFSLKTKVWIELDASRLEEITATRDSLDNLVIPQQTMKTIEALANRLKRQHTYSADHIAEKGSGGIILLHGPPGVGKTYTVEAIAEMLHRPLLALTVGDIGTKETMIERELAKWFALAELWEAVLLIDEADIFLERRQTRDLQRNGLVSAFLRRAEYFNGLLFLTTNRVGQIDDAFISRVHVAIQYPDLKGEDLARIWEGFFRKVASDETIKHKIVITPKTKAWVKAQSQTDSYKMLNGRDIRNALQTAITLAEFEHEEEMSGADSGVTQDGENATTTPEPVYVEREHFERVLNLTSNFHEYVDSIRRKDQAGRAGERGDRNDYLEKGE